MKSRTTAENRAASKEWYYTFQTPAKTRRKNLYRQYGIAPEDYDRMLAEQEGRCALCHKPPSGRGLFIDHNHETGAIRGLLCMRCNNALGWLGDSPDAILRAHAYLTKSHWMPDKEALRQRRRALSPQGYQSGKPKLTEAQALEIISLADSGSSAKGTARRYGVSSFTVSQIWKGLSWKHLPRP